MKPFFWNLRGWLVGTGWRAGRIEAGWCGGVVGRMGLVEIIFEEVSGELTLSYQDVY